MASAPPTGFVLKAYLTEANARADSNALQVTTNTAYLINKEQDANYNFFTHIEYYFRIEANDPVIEFYIDWDDGENNDPKGKANFSLIKLDTPNNIAITSHIFTRDKLHFPKIRVKSVDGFLSKFYQAAGDDTFEGIDVLAVGDALIDEGRNDRYRLENDKTNAERIPILAPTPRPPVGILKADKKRVFAGITNKYLAGVGGTYDGVTCRLIGSHALMDTTRDNVKVKVTYYAGGADQNDLGNTGSGELIETEMSITTTPTISNVLSVVKMELVDLRENTSENQADIADGTASSFNTSRLFAGEKMILVVDGSSAYQNDTPSVIGEVSMGNPILVLDDPKFSVSLDATESFCRSPEQTIDEYKIWDGDYVTNHGFDENTALFSASSTDTSDIFGAGAGRDTLRAASGIKTTSYAFHPSMTFTDEYHRWLPKQLLAIAQVKSSESAAKAATGTVNDTRATYDHSFVEHWVDESQSDNYGEDRAGIEEYNWPSDMTSSAFFAFKGPSDSDNWHDLNPFNRLTGLDMEHTLFHQTDRASVTGGTRRYANTSTNDLDQVNAQGAYMICARDSKWTKQHFVTKAYSRDTNRTASVGENGPYRAAPITVNGVANKTTANEWSGVSHAAVRVEIFYTARQDGSTNIIWKPLKRIDKTKHPYLSDSTFYSSGAMEWMEPEDWVECDPGDIPDRFWPGGDFESSLEPDTERDSFAYDSDATGNYFDVSNRWNATNKKYGLMWVLTSDGGVDSQHDTFGWGPDVHYSFPASNKNSVLIDIVDPMHVSLNTHAIAQSVSYNHKGKYQIIEDRMGKSEIRKIGATGGTLTFGGVDLKDKDGTFTRDKFYEYQKRAIPVFFDIEHKSRNISRFFGVITDMSEDHPVGKQHGKFGITMQCSHMIYFAGSGSSLGDGSILSDGYVSLGGDMIDEFDYI
jgi:hypothetical protein